ncbi:MAG: hypothetical protein ACP5G1_01920 [Nanopusillaceae archaeon]
MNIKSQTRAVGLFFILVGIAIFVYWILLPAHQKKIILHEILNGTNLTYYEYGLIGEDSGYYSITLNNIILSNSSLYYYITKNYQIGTFVPVYKVPMGSYSFSTNVFYGSKNINIYFVFNEPYTGINVTALSTCSGGYFNFYINGKKLSSTCENGIINIFIPHIFLNNGENLLEIEFVPNSIFTNSYGELKNIEIEYMQSSSLSFYYYHASGNVYLFYDFCEGNPQGVSLLINNISIPLTSCSYKLFISPYLIPGNNLISFKSNYPITIKDLYIESNQNIFYLLFPNNLKNKLLTIVVDGNGFMSLNGKCQYYLSPSTPSPINISNCLEPQNLLVIRPNNYLNIYTLYIS